MDKLRFYECVQDVINREHIRMGIGTYGEKTVHSVLKNYFAPYEGCHEQKIGGFVADIVSEDGIIEIQTAGFDKLRKKLTSFLSVSRVKVVHPIPYNKWLITINPETGETGKKRKSPQKGSPYDIFPELYKIKMHIANENLSICVVMIDIDEYRQPPETDGVKRGRRKGYTRYDRIPLEMHEEIHMNCKYDWQYFIPSALSFCEFTSKDFAKNANISVSLAQITLNVLTEIGAVKRVGKSGGSILYVSDCGYSE